MATILKPGIGLTAAILIICAVSAPARSQNLPGWGYAQRFIGDAQRQQRQYDRQQQQAARQQMQAQQQADARERAPHEASANYTGQLTPMGGDLARFVAGKTLYMERPIVAAGQIQSMKMDEVYFTADGKSYSVAWSGRQWLTGNNQVCLDSFQPQSCWQVFQDDTRQVFFLTSKNILMHISRVEHGDPANTKAQFAQRQQQEERQAKAVLGVIGAMSALGGGGGGGDSEATRMRDMNTQRSYENENRTGTR